ncbi:CinA family protein [Desulfonatronovibrio magnus]|uniref:CinA family protein n=1 Tax=Desulfonatronovibrio magnus TaxID=698827 RepID=UPI0005EBD8D4|nr:CinA family protein [Desulfonatronovibrio magnus]
MNIDQTIERLANILLRQKIMLCTAESCTGGLISHWLTNYSGSSGWFEGGIVSYSNAMKIHILGVNINTIEDYGAVSSQCVIEMAEGISRATGAQISIAVSGIAGPSGGTDFKPVGSVYVAFKIHNKVYSEHNLFHGNRLEIKMLTAQRALSGLLELFSKSDSSRDPT